MNNYERLVQITEEKVNLSKNFLEITKNMKNLINQKEFDSILVEIDRRNYIIEQVNSLDQNFLSIFENLKKDSNFENNIKSYPKIKEYIKNIEQNFRKSNEIDNDIKPNVISHLNNIKEEMKKLKDNQNNKILSNKYSQNEFKQLTESNFGIFIDSKN